MTDTDTPELTRGKALALVLALFGTSLAIVAHDLDRGTPQRALREVEFSSARLADGRWARETEAFLGRESDAMRTARPFWNEAMLGLFRETPRAVVAGRGRWLFSDPSLAPIEPAKVREQIGLMWFYTEALQRLARETGARFECHVVPSKWRVRGEHLHRAPTDALRLSLYPTVLAELGKRGIDAPDLLEFMTARSDTTWFPPNDTHLEQTGVRELVAGLVAPRLGIDAATARARLDALPTAPYEHPGNLPRQMSIRPDSAVGRLYSARDLRIEAPPTLDEPGADVVVLGDSHSKYHDFLFARLLAVATGLSVDARRADSMSLPEAEALARELAKRPARFIVFINTEQRFGGDI